MSGWSASPSVPRSWKLLVPAMVLVAICLAPAVMAAEMDCLFNWPLPKVVQPADKVGDPPPDAVVLFDGKDMSQWKDAGLWKVQDGYVVPPCNGQDIQSIPTFGDCQLHMEFATPENPVGVSQKRGNSGIFLMSLYEVQILDSYQNDTYRDGSCGAIYKQHPPIVNACRKPGEWQSFDIIFEGPRFDAEGNVLRPAYMTVLQNGIVVQHRFELQGRTIYERSAYYEPHPERMPLLLQDHRTPVRFRNIWVRDIKPLVSMPMGPARQPIYDFPDNMNKLTPEETAAGWKLLFRGKKLWDEGHLMGWRTYRAPAVITGWREIEGSLSRHSHLADDLISEEEFDNFILEFDYQIMPNADSGIYFRASEDEERGWMTGIELQLVDNDDPKYTQKTGWATELYQPAIDPKTGKPLDVTKPAKQWNHVKLVCDGPHIEHWINGVKLVEYEVGSDDFNQRVAKSKFAKMAKFAKSPKGYIILQGDQLDRGNVSFINMKILPLPAKDAKGAEAKK